MSGDVQPRKRKDKKRKKDELGVEEPRGTSAALGEGDVFMHSQHDHGTGGHWCAKIIFFSLLGILITLIGLIILENRGLSELDANAVESRYSGVFEGWLEDAPDDDHHDEHTLELNHHDDDEHDEEDDDEDDEIEVEKIEKEASEEEEPISLNLSVLPEDEDDGDDSKGDDDDDDGGGDTQEDDKDNDDVSEADDDDDDDFLEGDDELPIVERYTAPAVKPLPEVEDDDEEVSSERPPDTLEEEEEYEKQQEELRREEEQASHKDGGNSVEDHWPGEPVEAYWRQQLDELEEELRQGSWTTVAEKARVPELAGSARARYIAALALDKEAEAKRDNRLLSQAISAYLHLLKMNENLSDKKLKEVASRTIDRIQFRGNYLNAEPVYRLLIRRFPKDVDYRNNLTISFLMSNRGDLAEEVLKETLQLWPNDRIALAHYAFVLKTTHNKLEEAVKLFERALKGDKGPACEPRSYYHLGDALLLLGRFSEAHEVHKRGAKHGHFLSPSQRSLYNVPGLKSQPWWSIDETPYANFARALEKSWREILKEGLAAQALFEQEKEGLKERGEWSQLDLFVRGREVDGRCERTPVTCGVLRGSPAAACRRGQVKFSALAAGTHVRPHVGPTNCRLRLHLGLANTENTYLRVDQETRSWQEGKVLLFDDSFEHEVWHNGTGKRLVLIVDLWHPDLTPQQRRSLTAI